MSDNEELMQAALMYAQLGWRVFPCKPGEKKPATPDGFKSATTRPEQIKAWWTANPAYNIGVATGSGLLVVDLDRDSVNGKDGAPALDEWQEAHGAFPQTVCADTPRGGLHFYFTIPDGETVKSRVGVLDSVDIRGEGGYIVAPPSVVGGRAYRWRKHPIIYRVAGADSGVLALVHHGDVNGERANRDADAFSALPAMLDENARSAPLSEILGYLAAHDITLPKWAQAEITVGARTNMLIGLIGFLQGLGLVDEDIFAVITAFNAERCNPPLDDNELNREVFPALKRWVKGNAPQARRLAIYSQLLKLHPEIKYAWSDAGNSALFADLSENLFRFVHERRAWFVFRGKSWERDTTNQSFTAEQVRQIGVALSRYATQLSDENIKPGYVKFANKWQSFRTRDTILKDSSTIPRICLSASDFDRDSMLFNCLNGTLNLMTGEFRQHRAADLLCKLSGVEYNPSAKCERWLTFIDEITCGDTDLALYIQKLSGLCLTGDTSQESFYFLYGPTSRNGKGCFIEVLSRLLGDYAATASPETIAARKNSDSRLASGDIARLQGARFVSISEPDKSLTLNASLLKLLSGGDTVTARALYEAETEFKPQFKLIISTNHLPYLTDSTLFTSDRLKVIPFNRHFTEGERDPNLKRTLTTPTALSSVLNWAIEGLRLLQADGFKAPAAVVGAIEGYRGVSDKVGNFVADCLTPADGRKTPVKTIHARYQDWCFENGLKPEGLNEFIKSLTTAGITTKRTRPEGANRTANAAQMAINWVLNG